MAVVVTASPVSVGDSNNGDGKNNFSGYCYIYSVRQGNLKVYKLVFPAEKHDVDSIITHIDIVRFPCRIMAPSSGFVAGPCMSVVQTAVCLKNYNREKYI
jgi:hypothetical protein